MNRGLFLVLFLIASFLSGCSASVSSLAGQEAPPARLFQLEDGSTFMFEDFKGKTVVVAFWATTCTSSNPVMKRLARYADKFQSDPEVRFIAVSLDKLENIDRLKERIKYEDFYSMQHMFSGNEDFDEAFNALRGERMPYIVIIDRNGKVVAADTDDDFVREYIQPGKPMPLARIKQK